MAFYSFVREGTNSISLVSSLGKSKETLKLFLELMSLFVISGSIIGAVIEPEGVEGLGPATINSPVNYSLTAKPGVGLFLSLVWDLSGVGEGVGLLMQPQELDLGVFLMGVLSSVPTDTLFILTTTLLSPLFYCAFTY
jgi:hypothetical protein